jgi:hypothetical protein
MQYLKNGGWHTPEWYVEPETDGRQPVLTLQFWDYHRLIELYSEVFGARNLLVLPYELFKNSPAEFVGHIARFAGAPTPAALDQTRTIANPRKPHVSSYYLRHVTAFYRRTSANAFMPSILGSKFGKVVDRGLKGLCTALIPTSLERKVEKTIEDRISKKIGSYFATSNLEASRHVGFDLRSLGYDVATEQERLGTRAT